jgi:hypothetical protein
MISGMERIGSPPPGTENQNCTMRPASGYGSGRRKAASMSEKMAVLAPIAMVSVRIAVMAKTGLRRNRVRAARRKFCMIGGRTAGPGIGLPYSGGRG